MTRWLNDIQLTGPSVQLEPMTIAHSEELTEAAKDGQLWNLWYTTVPAPDGVAGFIQKATDEYEEGKSLPFIIRRKETGKVVGSTRFLNVDAQHKRLEIGHTFYGKSTQRTGINTECKFLLLEYAFETLGCNAVEFRTHWHNHPSRRAIERLGAKQDGVLRNHKIDRFGIMRDTVVYSILNTEWPTVKKSLEFMMNRVY